MKNNLFKNRSAIATGTTYLTNAYQILNTATLVTEENFVFNIFLSTKYPIKIQVTTPLTDGSNNDTADVIPANRRAQKNATAITCPNTPQPAKRSFRK